MWYNIDQLTKIIMLAWDASRIDCGLLFVVGCIDGSFVRTVAIVSSISFPVMNLFRRRTASSYTIALAQCQNADAEYYFASLFDNNQPLFSLDHDLAVAACFSCSVFALIFNR